MTIGITLHRVTMRFAIFVATQILTAASCRGSDVPVHETEGEAILIASHPLVGLPQVTPVAASVLGTRLVFFDLDQRALMRFEATSLTTQQLGRVGSGPGEYRLVTGTVSAGRSIVAIDPQLRRIVRFDEMGVPAQAIELGLGGHRTVVHYSDTLLLAGGMYSKASDPNGRYAVFSKRADGRPILSTRFELSENPIERRSTILHVAKCGAHTLAVARSDSLFVLLVNQNDDSDIRRVEFPASANDWAAADTGQIEAEQLFQRQRIIQIVGGLNGCVAMSAPRTASADSSRILVFVREGQQPLRWRFGSSEHLAAVVGDTLHSIDFELTPPVWKLYKMSARQ